MTLFKFSNNSMLSALEAPLQEVFLEQWRENPAAHAGATALVIPNDVRFSDSVDDLSGFSVIILQFPAFKDGRAYSQARILRERLGYAGEIRARGDVLRDQLLFMVRCGFDAFELAGEDSSDAQASLHEFSFSYQSAADNEDPVWRKRLLRADAA